MPRPTKPIERRTPIRRANPRRRAEKHQRNFDGTADVLDHDGWIRARPCCVCLASHQNIGPSQAAHAVARGMGGAKGAWWHLVPLCRRHHDEQEANGNDWIRDHYGVDLRDLARAMTRKHLTALGAI